MAKGLTEAEIEEYKLNLAKDIALARQKLLMKHRFIGNIVMQLNLIPVRDKRVRTAMTDGTSVYFDIAFCSDLNPDELRFILAHETWHCVYMHMLRRKGRDPLIFNYATDMEINRMLKNDGFTPPPDVLFPKDEWGNKSAEEMYELLLKDLKKKSKSCKSKSGKSSPSSGSNGSDDSNDFDNLDPSDYTKGKSKSGKIKGQFDKHMYEGQDKDSIGKNIGDVTDKWGEVGYDKDFNPSVSRDLAEKIREKVLASAEMTQRTAGGLPMGLEEYLEKLRKPEISWQEVLQQFVTSCYNGKRRWLPPARRHVYQGIYLQSRRDEKIRVAVAIDTSGSCYNDLPKFFGELVGLLNSFGNYELILIQNDYEISSVDRYDIDNPFPENPKDIKWTGGGGTSFLPPFKWIEQNQPELDCMIFFTDGEEYFDDGKGGVVNYPCPSYPVLWVLTKDGNENCCPWGQKIRFKNDTDETDWQ